MTDPVLIPEVMRYHVERMQRNNPWAPTHGLGGPWVDMRKLDEYMRTRGRAWTAQPLPEGYERGEPKMCYSNASVVAMNDDGVRYCEGWMTRPETGMSFFHAWCVDDEGNVIDPTIDNPEEAVYWGVAYDTDEYAEFLVREDSEYYGVLADDMVAQERLEELLSEEW